MASDLGLYDTESEDVVSTALPQQLTMLLSRGHATSGEPN
jgi:hypothetical protein